MAQKGFVNFDKRYGGMSEVDTLMAEGQYVYSENIDIRRDPDFIELNHKPELRFITNELIVSGVQGQQGAFFFGQSLINDNVYNESGFVVLTTSSGNYNFVNSLLVGTKIIFVYTTGAGTVQIGCIDAETAPQGAAWIGDPSFMEQCNLNPIAFTADAANYWLGRVGAAPPPPSGQYIGETWLDTAANQIYAWDGTVWNALAQNDGDRFISSANGQIRYQYDAGVWTAFGFQYDGVLTNSCIPVFDYQGVLYIGVGRYIKRLTNDLTNNGMFLVEDAATFSARVVSISLAGNLLKVYLENGEVWYRDGFSNGVQSGQKVSTSFRYAKTFGAYTYIVGGGTPTQSELYLNQGLQFQGLKFAQRSEGAENKPKYVYDIANRCGENNMIQYQNIIYTAGVNGEDSPDDKYFIASWGNKWNGFPMAFNVETTLNHNGDEIDSIGMVYKPYDNVMFYSWEVNGQYGVDLVNLTLPFFSDKKFQPTGVLYTQKLVLDHTETKRMYAVEVRYGNTAPGRTITVEYALDGGAYQLLKVIDENIDVERKESKFQKIIRLDEIPQDYFFEIQFKLTFDTDNEDESPRLYKFKPLYEINEQ